MKVAQLLTALALVLFSTSAWAEATSPQASHMQNYTMLNFQIKRPDASGYVVKAACTGKNTCCCRAGSQIYCSTPSECSRAGGACSAGCN